MIGKTNAISVVSAPVPQIKTVSGSVISISDALAQAAESLVVDINAVQSGSGDPSPSNVRPISGWSNVNVYREAQYDAGATPYATINLNGTVYGGSLDVTTGVLTVSMYYTELDGRTWTKEDNASIFSCNSLTGIYAKALNYNFICNKYKSVEKYRSQLNNMEIGTYNGTNGRNRFTIRDDRFDNVSDFVASISDIVVCYELATPQTVQLTPTQVQMLLGNNVLWADSGDSELQYWARR